MVDVWTKVYVVCMPGEPAYPVLAVCRPSCSTDTISDSSNKSKLGDQTNADTEQGRHENDYTSVRLTEDGTNTNTIIEQHDQTSSPLPIVPAAATTHKDPPVGFLLQWETPDNSKQTPVSKRAEGEVSGLPRDTAGSSETADVVVAEAGQGERGFGGHYGGGGRRRGHREVTTMRFFSVLAMEKYTITKTIIDLLSHYCVAFACDIIVSQTAQTNHGASMVSSCQKKIEAWRN